MSLFIHLIIVDHRIHREEIKSFVEAGQALRLKTEAGVRMSRRDLFQFFENRIKPIRDDAKTNEMHTKLIELFHKLQYMPDKQKALDWMCVIALSDGSVHVNERLIIALAAGHWDLHPPVWEERRGTEG